MLMKVIISTIQTPPHIHYKILQSLFSHIECQCSVTSVLIGMWLAGCGLYVREGSGARQAVVTMVTHGQTGQCEVIQGV